MRYDNITYWLTIFVFFQLILVFGGIPFIWEVSTDTLGYFGYGTEYEVTLATIIFMKVK